MNFLEATILIKVPVLNENGDLALFPYHFLHAFGCET